MTELDKLPVHPEDMAGSIQSLEMAHKNLYIYEKLTPFPQKAKQIINYHLKELSAHLLYVDPSLFAIANKCKEDWEVVFDNPVLTKKLYASIRQRLENIDDQLRKYPIYDEALELV